ncbi:MAG: SoxR reducing system RseC family protein [Rhodospirillales bacterium]|nr:SoxR reducing system RseC family protein [Rhodospirillales bacterium]
MQTQDTLEGGFDDGRPLRSQALVEGFARIVAVEGQTAWAEPERAASCGSCATVTTCGSATAWFKLTPAEASRFPLANDFNARIGERIVVGIRQGSLLRASSLAYALPLVTLIGAGLFAQAKGASEGLTILASLAGFALGLLIAHRGAKFLAARGDLAPVFLRRSSGGECDLSAHA